MSGWPNPGGLFPEGQIDPPDEDHCYPTNRVTRVVRRSLHPSRSLVRRTPAEVRRIWREAPTGLPGDTELPVKTLEETEDVPW